MVTIVIVALIYEILFLPGFAYFSQFFQNSKIILYPLVAFICGTLSCLIAILAYNNFPDKLKEIMISKDASEKKAGKR